MLTFQFSKSFSEILTFWKRKIHRPTGTPLLAPLPGTSGVAVDHWLTPLPFQAVGGSNEGKVSDQEDSLWECLGDQGCIEMSKNSSKGEWAAKGSCNCKKGTHHDRVDQCPRLRGAGFKLVHQGEGRQSLRELGVLVLDRGAILFTASFIFFFGDLWW